jgi:hypothetical protein
MSVGTGRQKIITLIWKLQFHFWEYINGNQTFILDSHRPFICSVGNKFMPAETRVEYRAGIEPGPAVHQDPRPFSPLKSYAAPPEPRRTPKSHAAPPKRYVAPHLTTCIDVQVYYEHIILEIGVLQYRK